MKIVTWNCNGALRKKFNSLNVFSADLNVIQECENPEITNDKNYKEWAKNYLWIGDNKNKGLGIFAGDRLTLTKLDWDSNGLKYFLPCRVNNDFNLVGAWCHGANSPTFGYIGQLWKYIQLHKSKFDKCIIAGDFNSNVIWDKWDRWWNHSDVVRELRELRVESLYHLFKNEVQGKETLSTLYLQRNLNKSYHIDYIFGSDRFQKHLKHVTIGPAEKWLEISDHMPVFCEINE
jgi:exonuclease III